jgi:HTH-type transcriptional regulator, sugar sensing transcriptional regulator
MLYEKLQKIGLTEKEAKVYASLLELGETSIQRVAKKAKIKRTSVYNVIDTLKEKGLISTTFKKRRKLYSASDPRDLGLKMDEQKAVLRKIMPELLSIANFIDKKPRIKFYDGIEGIKEIYLDSLKYPGQPVWAWVADAVLTDYFDREFLEYYIPKRVENKIMAYVITPDSPKLEAYKYKEKDEKSLRKTRIDPESSGIEVEIDIYGNNKVAIMSFTEGFGIIIESQKIYNTLKSIFDVAWKKLE